MRLKGKFLTIEKKITTNNKEFAVAEIDDGKQPISVSIWSESMANEWSKLKAGDEVEAEITEKNGYKNMQESIIPKVEKETDDFENLDALLKKAHAKAKNMKAELFIKPKEIHADYDKKQASFKSKVSIVQDNRVLTTASGHGFAEEEKLKDHMKEYWYVMAETRSLVRALRWITCSSKAGKEEIN